MIVHIANLLSAQDLEYIRRTLKQVEFRDGQASAHTLARTRKNNLEFSAAGTPQQKIDELLVARLYAHPECQALLPHKIAHPYYACYEAGMSYGDHTDDPIMGQGERYRSDIAVTVFLNDGSEYQGGELIINTQTPSAMSAFKGAAGAAVLYPATGMHRVETVSSGTRLVAVTWIQSLIREAHKRELVYHLGALRTNMIEQASDDSDAQQANGRKANWVYTNLVRLWSDV